MSPVKEPCYFADEIRAHNIDAAFLRNLERQTRLLPKILRDRAPVKPLGWIAQDWDDYLRLFRGVRAETAIGEATAAYLWSETAAANIHRAIPHARIVILLRDPAERAFSHYLHQRAAGYTLEPFRRHIERCLRDPHRRLSIYYPFLEAGLYSAQVKRFLDLFPRERVRIYWYEEAWRDPARLLADLFAFLGVDPSVQIDTAIRMLERRAPRFERAHYYLKKLNLWAPLRAAMPARLLPALRRAAFTTGKSLTIHPDERRLLIDYYGQDIQRLSALLGRDLASWLV